MQARKYAETPIQKQLIKNADHQEMLFYPIVYWKVVLPCSQGSVLVL